MSGPRNPVLESLIADEPDNDSIKLVYGDWLQARGNAWGEFIALQDGLFGDEPRVTFEWDDPAGIRESVRERPYDEVLYGASLGSRRALWRPSGRSPVDPAAIENERENELRTSTFEEIFTDGGEQPQLWWNRGFLRAAFLPQGAGFRDILEDTLIRLLEHPVSLALDELVLGAIEWRGGRHRGLHYQPELDVLQILAPRALRRLVLGAWAEHDISWTAIGDLTGLYEALPRLEALELQAGVFELGDIALPNLRTLLLRCGGLNQDSIRAVQEARCPKLESLTLWFGTPEYGGSDDSAVAEPLLSETLFPALRRLGLANAEFTDELCEMLPSAPILPRLEELDLSLGTMSDVGARQLLRERDRLSHLTHLDVRGNALSPAVCLELETAFASVDTRFQKHASRRYVSVSE